MHTALRLRIATFAFLVWIALSVEVSAQPTTYRVLKDAILLEGNDCTYIQIEFNFPVQYINHFPPKAGEELRIQVNPIITNVEERAALLLREALSPPRDADVGLLSIIYDGDLSSGPVLTLQFRRPLSYSVGQGRDFRSVLVGIPGPDRTTPCLPLN
ncbi:MAG: hypothetical protein QNL90_14765 [Gammaproteobacteria bacterium]|nr:hypothetical protein [Gammaproteobacteria bacterium]MDX2461406.1 hypothetical protein [Gammaproteobacteria bacterium]